jgi:suppressor of fused protein SUFU
MLAGHTKPEILVFQRNQVVCVARAPSPAECRHVPAVSTTPRPHLGVVMPASDWQEWFEQAWEIREDKLYPALFGSLGPGIYPLDAELFNTVFRQDSIDPRWLHHGVFECAPTNQRTSWLYVSSGLSNAWEADAPDPSGPSGLGCEFVFQCHGQSPWAIVFLRKMVAFQILLSCGRFERRGLLQVGDRVPLRAPIDGASSRLNWVVLTSSTEFQGSRQLPTGRFEFLQFVGITEAEAEFARQSGSNKLYDLLVAQRAAPVTDPHRSSILPSTTG